MKKLNNFIYKNIMVPLITVLIISIALYLCIEVFTIIFTHEHTINRIEKIEKTITLNGLTITE